MDSKAGTWERELWARCEAGKEKKKKRAEGTPVVNQSSLATEQDLWVGLAKEEGDGGLSLGGNLRPEVWIFLNGSK